ncbi:MAG: hypothetical protein B1H13_02710 [Desulfobacteraceae bacterium 4484_190.3]|nr:MAG: hypothetical protein B1H13_02710 [Desulfobacteraceae bacterium 4484_190.3]
MSYLPDLCHEVLVKIRVQRVRLSISPEGSSVLEFLSIVEYWSDGVMKKISHQLPKAIQEHSFLKKLSVAVFPTVQRNLFQQSYLFLTMS